ncbi:MAG: ACT domain-containing protein [Acidimicrobiales bacterium]|nr:ACT domain-containing protein [Acidimicrobiales bacterium]
MTTYVLRVWLPDRPGALGAVASRVGAVGADVIGIDILERGGGRAIDELIIDLPESALVPLLLQEVQEVDGVDVEDIREATGAALDPRLDALEAAAALVGAPSSDVLLDSLCEYAVATLAADWGAVFSLDGGELYSVLGPAPTTEWLVAFVEGSRSSARLGGEGAKPDDVVWAALASAGYALVLGREGRPFRARERREVSALARIVDTRFRSLRWTEARSAHPSSGQRSRVGQPG